MSLALAQPKPRVSLAAVNLDSVHKIREWVKDPYYAEYFRRYAPEFTWGDDAAVAASINVKILGTLQISGANGTGTMTAYGNGRATIVELN